MAESIDAFFDAFLERFNAHEMDQLHAVYDEPVVWIRPTGVRVFDTREAFADQMAKLRKVYEDSGLVATRKSIRGFESFGVGLHLVHVAWKHLRQDGSTLAEVTTTYILRETNGSYTVAAHVSHDEMFQRPVGGPSTFDG